MAIDDIKAAWELLKKTTSIESQEIIMTLREDHLSLREEILQLKEENSKLRSETENAENLFYEDPYYWKIDGDVKDGPFCQLCNDKQKKQIRLQTGYTKGNWKCHNCKSEYFDKDYIEPDFNSTTVDYSNPFK